MVLLIHKKESVYQFFLLWNNLILHLETSLPHLSYKLLHQYGGIAVK